MQNAKQNVHKCGLIMAAMTLHDDSVYKNDAYKNDAYKNDAYKNDGYK